MPDIETLDLSVKSYATIKRMGINTTVLLHTQKAGEEAIEKLNALSVVSTEQRKQAFELHYRIISSADTAQSALWDMCKNLKEMRDSKLYKALGYKNFEDYCEKEVGMKRRNVECIQLHLHCGKNQYRKCATGCTNWNQETFLACYSFK